MDLNNAIVFYSILVVVLIIFPGLGTYLPVKYAQTPAERAFLGRVAIACWVAVALLIVLPQVLVFHDVIAPRRVVPPLVILGAATILSVNRIEAHLQRIRMGSRD